MTAARGIIRLDIHEDDLTARIAIRDQLTACRRQTGLTQAEAANAVGMTSGWLRRFEAHTDASAWLDTYNRIAKFYRRQLTVTPVGVPYYNPALPTIYDLFTGVAQRQYATFARLVFARIDASVSLKTVGLLTGVSESAVCQQEGLKADTCNVARWQRYTRALGGRLDLDLVPVDKESVAA